MFFFVFYVVALVLQTTMCSAAARYRQDKDGCHLFVDGNIEDTLTILETIDGASFEGDAFHVCLSGENTFGEEITLDKRHNIPGKRVVWRSAKEMDPSVVQDLVPLTSWFRCNDGVHCPSLDWNDVWVHYVSDVANLTADMVPIRNMWTNVSRMTRVSDLGDELGWKVIESGFSATENVSTSFVSDEVELLWPRVVRNWIEPRCIVTAVDGKNITVDPICWGNLIQRNNGELPPIPIFVENIVKPPPPGQFASTRDYIFVRPPSSTPYAVPSDARVPTQSRLLSASNLVNHTFENIVFRGTTWRVASQGGGYVPSQTLVLSSHGEPYGAVSFENVRNLVVRNCTFENIGAPYALYVGNRSQHVVVSGNTLTDLSGGAIKLGNVLNDTRALSTNPRDWDVDYLLHENTLTNVAVEFKGAAAIFAGYVAETNISQNTIASTGYTAISLGWGWGAHVQGPQTFAADNHVVGNHMTQVCSSLNDCGCVYTLGPQPRSTVTSNFCSADSAPVVGCFYHDNGSRYFNTTKNVCTSSPAPCCYLQGCCNAPAYDCHVSDLWCRDVAPVINECEAENCTIDNATLYILSKGESWPPEAQAIVDSSGAGAVRKKGD
eukprot:g1145.t1